MIIHIGANHIPQTHPHELMQLLSKMYKDVRNIFPGAKIYNLAMIPRHNNGALQMINGTNENIELYCRTLNIKTIRHPQFGTNELNYNMLKSDLVHPAF